MEYSGYRIVLDAGHGGEDGGTVAEGAMTYYNQTNDVMEKEINLAVVLKMKSLLEQFGIEVFLTRETDETIGLNERVEIAKSKDADLFVSIHCNYYEDDSAISGLECYYYEDSESGRQCAETILEAIAYCGNLNTRNVKEGDFFVLRKTNIPAVLVELGYLSNVKECQRLTTEEYQEVLAKELVKGILEALEFKR